MRRLMRSTPVLFLQPEGHERGCGDARRLRQAAGGGSGSGGGQPSRLGRWCGHRGACAHLVDTEVTRRWSPVATLRSKHTEVCRAAAGEKGEEEKAWPLSRWSPMASPLAVPGPLSP